MTQLVTPAALYGLAVDLVNKGWQPVWCLPRMTGKFSPMGGVTGSAPFPTIVPQPSGAHKLACRPPQNVVMLDVDHYDGKRGMDTMDKAEAWLGDLPETWRITSRGFSNPSGRYLFRKPEDLEFTDSALAQFADEDGRTHIEIIRTAHRFSWAAGEIHYKNNEIIKVYDPYGDECEMPYVAELPELPERWVDYLRNPPVPYSTPAYQRPNDGPDWWLSQADESLGTRAELAQFAFDLLGSRMSPEDALVQIRRVAKADDPSRPWEDRDFYGLVDRNTERKVGEQLSRQDAVWELGVAVAGDEASLRARLAEQNAGYAAQQELVARVEPSLPFDAAAFKAAVQRLPVAGLVVTDDIEQIVNPSAETLIRSMPGYPPLLFHEVARTLAKKDAAKILAVDFTGYKALSQLRKPPVPETMLITGKNTPHTAIIPPQTVTVLSGHKGGGKSWVTATWAAQEIRAGGHILWIDFERQAEGLNERLGLLGVPAHLIDEQVHYADGVLPPVDLMTTDIKSWAVGGKRVLVVVDAFRGLQATVAPGTSANDGDAVEAVYIEILNPLVQAGATVVCIDHLPKTATGPTATTFGSERKESAADYVLTVEQAAPFSRKKSGFSVLTITKDRFGHREAGEVVGYLWVAGNDDKVGKSIRDWPAEPELRSWSPASEAALEQLEVSEKSQRIVAVTQVVRENPLRLGMRQLSQEVSNQYPELFPAKEDAGPSNRYSAALSFIQRMKRDGQLFLDLGNKTLGLPEVVRPESNSRLTALLNGEEE